MSPRPILAAHVGVLGGVMWLISSAGFATASTAVVVGIGVTPLLAALPGLRAGRRYTQQWAAIALVFYVGTALAEAIATQARSLPAIVLLFASATELALLLRALHGGRPASRGSTES